MRRLLSATMLFVTLTVLGQTNTDQSQPATTFLKNHHILLVPSGAPGTGMAHWIAVAPDGQLSILPVSHLQEKMGEGYRPFTFGEFQDALAVMMNQNAALAAEVKRLEQSQVNSKKTTTDQQDVAAAAMVEARKQADAQRREEQRRQAILMFLMGQQTQRVNMNVNVTDCTKYPALCVSH